MERLHGGTFRFWQNQSSWWTVTFVEGTGRLATIRWIRNNRFAGLRRVESRLGAHRRQP